MVECIELLPLQLELELEVDGSVGCILELAEGVWVPEEGWR